MNTLLQQIYNGNLCPPKHSKPKTKAYEFMEQKHMLHYKKFMKKLKKANPALVEQFMEILDEQATENLFEFSQIFIDGFKMGAKMMIEIFETDCPDQK